MEKSKKILDSFVGNTINDYSNRIESASMFNTKKILLEELNSLLLILKDTQKIILDLERGFNSLD